MADHMTAEQISEELHAIMDCLDVPNLGPGLDQACRKQLIDLAARLSALPAQGVPDGWLPIESAPKRTRVIVGYRNSQGKWRTAMATYFTADDIAEWENDDCAPGWYERSYAHEAENEYVYALEAEPLCWQSRPPEPPHG